MKKVFVEPKMKRIELNLKENIASSVQMSMGYYFLVSLFTCVIINTGKKLSEGATEEEAIEKGCLINGNSRIGGGTIVPQNEVRPYFRRY